MCYNTDRKKKTKEIKKMKFYGYYVNGKNYGCNKVAKENAEKAAAETGAKVERHIYKI